MDTQALFSHGGELVKNPNYSPNNGQPEFILNTDISKRDNSLASAFYNKTAAGENYTIQDEDIIRKTKKYGVPLTREGIESGLIDKQLYNAQSRFSKIFNSLEQTIVGEIGLGTIKAFSELADIIGNAITQNDIFDESAVTKFLSDLKEKNKKAFDINTDPNVHLGSGALTNLGWYAENFPSIASNITLLIPAKFTTTILSKSPKLLSKGAKFISKTEDVVEDASKLTAFSKKGKKAIKTLNENLASTTLKRELRTARLETLSDVAFMRTLENYQEAKQVNADMFDYAKEEFKNDDKYKEYLTKNPELLKDLQKEGIDINDKDEVARYISKKAAVKTFAIDYANIVFDIIQLSALKNPIKVNKSRVWQSRKVAQAQRRSIEKPLEQLSSIELSEKSLTKGKKIINYFKDIAGHIPTIAAEATEGIEEAVNYIAQQEGMTYGKILLGSGEEKNLFKSDRLSDYWKSPEMWDAAFWGFAGGIAFEIGASKFNVLHNALSEKRKDKKEGNEIKPFSEYLKNNEDRIRINDISGRSVEFNNLINNLKIVNDGKNPFKRRNDGTYEEFANDLERDNVIQQIKNDTAQNLGLNAAQSGNYYMLKAFLQNPNLRKALIDSEVIDEKDSDSFIDDMITRMDHAVAIYEEQLYNLDKLTKSIKEKVPVEYLQIIARKNTNALLDIESLNLDKDVYQKEVDKLMEHVYNNVLDDPSAPLPDLKMSFEDKTKLNVLSYRLAEIQAKLKILKEDEEIRTSINGAISINKLEKQRDIILNEIQRLNTIDSTAAVIWALLQAENSIIDDEGNLQINQLTKSFNTYAQGILNKDEKLVKELLTNNGLEKLANDLDINAFVTDDKQGSYNIFTSSLKEYQEFIKNNQYLHHQQQNLEYIKLLELETKSDIINNTDDLLKQINSINDALNDAVNEGQKQAEKNILDIASKLEDGEQSIYDYIFNGKPIKNISDEDLAILDDAITLLKFRERSEGYYERFSKILGKQFREKLIKEEQEKENSSKSQNPQQASQTTQTDNISQSQQKSNTRQQTSSNGLNNQQNTLNLNGKAKITISANEDTKLSIEQVNDDVNEKNVVGVTNLNNGNYILNVKESKNNVEELTESTTLFSIFDFSNGDSKAIKKIIRNPIIQFDNNGKPIVVQKGQVSIEASSSFTGEVEQNDNQQQNEAVDYDPGLAETEKGREISRKRNDIIVTNLKDWVDKNYTQKNIIDEINKKLKEEFKDEDQDVLNAVMAETGMIVASWLDISDNPELAQAVKTLINIETSHSTLEEKHSMTTDILQAVNQILPYYINKHELSAYKSKIDNKPKYYINLQQLLEDIDNIYKNKQIVQTIYKFIKDYLNTDEGKSNYIITDLDVNSEDFLERINQKSDEQKQSEDFNIQEVNIRNLNSKEFEELISLNSGATLTVSIEKIEDKNNVTRKKLLLKHNDVKVGTLTLANYNNGVYSLFNDGWNYELSNDNGHISSNLLDLFVELLQNRDIYNTLLQIRNENTSEKDKEKLKKYLSDLLKNYVYNGKRLGGNIIFESDGTLGSEETESYQEVNHLLQLISYDLAKETYESAQPKLKNSLYNFMKKLYDSYDSAKHLEDRINEGQNVTLTVNSTPIGIFESPIKNKVVTKEDYSKLKQSNIALSEIDNVKIGVQETTGKGNSGKVKFSDGSEESIPRLFVGDIIVSIPNNKGYYFNTRALSTRFNDTDLDINSDAAKVVDFIRSEFDRRVDDWKNNDEHFGDFVNFIRTLFYRNQPNERNINEPILAGIKFYDSRNTDGTIQLRFSDKIIIHLSKDNITTSVKQSDNTYKHTTYTRDGKSNINNLKKVFKNVLDNAYFNISLRMLKDFSPANINKIPTSGFIEKEGNGLQLRIPSITGQDFTLKAKNYKDFLLKGGFIKVNAQKHKRTFKEGDKITIVNTGNFNYSRFSKLTVKVPSMYNNNTPVKEEMTKIEASLTPIEKAIRSKRENAFNSAFRIAGLDKVTIDGKEFNVLNTLKRFGLYTNKIIFDENFNKKDKQNNYTGAIAKVNKSTGEVTIGIRWLDMFNLKGRYSNPENRAQAVRKLIHEMLHLKFNEDGNDVYVERLREVFDEFKDAVNKITNKEEREFYQSYFFSELNDADALEEFVVESFTNDNIASFLNSVKAGDYKIGNVEKKNRTLFQKILDFLSKLFNWNITDDSLYAKEFILLGKAISNVENKQTVEIKQKDVQQQENQIVEDEKPLTEGELDIAIDSFLNGGFDNISYSTREERIYTSEMQAIKDKAIADGTFMKAPNGNPTNLTERQWLQVRTKSFKDWFGDWISAPENASKVVDENGEPLVVYHGSKDNTFTIFDRSKNDKGQKGFFFTNSEVMASSYGKNPRGFFLNIRDPYTVEGNGSNWNAIYVTTSSIAKDKLDAIRLYKNQLQLALQEGTTNKEIYDFWDREYFQYLDKYNSLGNSTVDKIKKYILQRRLNTFQSEGTFIKSTRYVENILEYDTDDVSIIFKNITDYGPVFNIEAAKATVGKVPGNVYVVTNPNQIKSATDNNGEFSRTNNNIYQSTREERYNDKIYENINDFINDAKPEDKQILLEKINSGEISIKCK